MSLDAHPGFKDMTGQLLGTARVLERVRPNAPDGTAMWRCRCEACGHVWTVQSIRLRRHKHPCPQCRPSPGTGKRRRR